MVQDKQRCAHRRLPDAPERTGVLLLRARAGRLMNYKNKTNLNRFDGAQRCEGPRDAAALKKKSKRFMQSGYTPANSRGQLRHAQRAGRAQPFLGARVQGSPSGGPAVPNLT